MNGWAKRVSVVTGGASGIGAACVANWRPRATVVVVDRDLAKAQAVAAESAAARMRRCRPTSRASRLCCGHRSRVRRGRGSRQQRRHHPDAGTAARTADDARGTTSCASISAAPMWPASRLPGR